MDSLIDHTIFILAGTIAVFSNKRCRLTAFILFFGFSFHDVLGDLILKVLNVRGEAAVYVSYAAIQIATLIAFTRLKCSKVLISLVSLNLIVNSVIILDYIIVTNFGEMDFDLHAAYNPMVWSLMIAQLLFLLWTEEDVVIHVRRQGYKLWSNSSLYFMDRIMRISRRTNRGSK